MSKNILCENKKGHVQNRHGHGEYYKKINAFLKKCTSNKDKIFSFFFEYLNLPYVIQCAVHTRMLSKTRVSFLGE